MHCSQKTGQKLRLLFIYRTWTVPLVGGNTWKKKKKTAVNLKHSKRYVDPNSALEPKYLIFFNSIQCALFTEPQILLFSNFFIKNGFHGTIHIYIYINYFATVFFSFQFQFSVFSYIQIGYIYTSEWLCGTLIKLVHLVCV